ncbi:MAG: NAD(+) synthase, partial [Thermotogae bacterium]
GFEKVILGLSGGIDSSLVAVIAVEALGNNNVVGVLMPSAYTSKESIEDAHKLASNLEIKTLTLPIVKPYEMLNEILVSAFNDSEFGITQENLQARLRGVILMALSNKFGWLVLTTGNKSEIAVGYCTLYGDTAGALAVIGDVFKTDVYRLVRWYNRARSPVIPQRVLSKAPSAELRKGQVDQESLPDYDVLDKILKEILNKKGISEIANLGYPSVVVEDVVKKVLKSEYKRRQLPPQIIVSETPLGHNWSMPIANRCQTL